MACPMRLSETEIVFSFFEMNLFKMTWYYYCLEINYCSPRDCLLGETSEILEALLSRLLRRELLETVTPDLVFISTKIIT